MSAFGTKRTLRTATGMSALCQKQTFLQLTSIAPGLGPTAPSLTLQARRGRVLRGRFHTQAVSLFTAPIVRPGLERRPRPYSIAAISIATAL
jgi:hypothetical protein